MSRSLLLLLAAILVLSIHTAGVLAERAEPKKVEEVVPYCRRRCDRTRMSFINFVLGHKSSMCVVNFIVIITLDPYLF